MWMRAALAASVVAVSLVAAGCASPQPETEDFNGIVAVSRSNDEILLRGASCVDDQPIAAFRLAPSSGPGEPLVWPITPDTDATARVGTVDELGPLLGDDEWVLSVDGVDGPVLELLVTWADLDAMEVRQDRTPLVPGAPERYDFDDAVLDVCGAPSAGAARMVGLLDM